MHEHRHRPGRDAQSRRRAVPLRGLDHGVGTRALNGRERQGGTGQPRQLLVHRGSRGVEDHDQALESGVQVGADGVVHPHHDDALVRVRTSRYREGDLGIDGVSRAEPEQG